MLPAYYTWSSYLSHFWVFLDGAFETCNLERWVARVDNTESHLQDISVPKLVRADGTAKPARFYHFGIWFGTKMVQSSCLGHWSARRLWRRCPCWMRLADWIEVAPLSSAMIGHWFVAMVDEISIKYLGTCTCILELGVRSGLSSFETHLKCGVEKDRRRNEGTIVVCQVNTAPVQSTCFNSILISKRGSDKGCNSVEWLCNVHAWCRLGNRRSGANAYDVPNYLEIIPE